MLTSPAVGGFSDFNPRSPHGERHDFRHSPERAEAISIHAPRTGSDERCDCGCSQTDISIHAPRTGSDRTLRNLVNIVNSFQSTLPARGATRYHFFRRLSNVISIHAPRTGSDCTRWMPCPATAYFNPRSPHGERRDIITAGRDDACDFNPRSPHGERRLYGSHARRLHHFNPRSPHGERHIQMFIGFARQRFQSTLPARGATARLWVQLSARSISIHAPRTGSDQGASSRPSTSLSFQSTLPARGATIKQGHTPGKERFQSTLPARGATVGPQSDAPFISISIHAPRTGSDAVAHGWSHGRKISIHAPRTGSDDFGVLGLRMFARFQSTLPARGATCHSKKILLQRWIFQSTLPARGATIPFRAWSPS